MNAPEILLSAAEVADLAGVDETALRNLHPDDFGVPGHWSMNKQGVVTYTERGLAGLVDALAAAGHAGAAALHAKLVELRQERDTPSRHFAPAGEKGGKPGWWQTGSMG